MLHLVQKQISFISAESASQHVLSLQALWLVPFDGQPTCTGSRRTSTGCGCAAFCTMWNPPHAVLNTPYPLSPRKCSSTCYVLPSLSCRWQALYSTQTIGHALALADACPPLRQVGAAWLEQFAKDGANAAQRVLSGKPPFSASA